MSLSRIIPKPKSVEQKASMALLMAATPNFEGPDPSHGMERRVAARSFLGIHISNIFSKGGPRSYVL